MADTTYQDKVYRKQGAEELVVANGGAITIESGGAIANESGSSFTVESGSTFEAEETANVTWFTETFTGKAMRLIALSPLTVTNWGASGTNVSGDSIISPAYGHHNYDLATGMSKTSLQLPSADKGAQLFINFGGAVGDANMSLFASTGGGLAGVSVIGQSAVVLSSFELSAAAWLHLVCYTEGQWQVARENDSVTERAAS